jgi:hypothetical protein
MRRTIMTILLAILVATGLAAAAVAMGGGSTVTSTRLERSLPRAFSNVYAQEAALLGHKGITPASLHARAMCDNAGTKTGTGAAWVCLMSWHDPNNPMPSTGYGKFELNVHSNDCYTAGSPSSLIGYQTITDTAGRTVNNPAYEFDACFDPHSDNSPTGVTFPSELKITTTTLDVDAHGNGSLGLACGTGAGGCAGHLTVTAGGTPIARLPYHLAENSTATLPLRRPLPAGVKEVDLAVTMSKGVGSTSATVPVARS